MRNMRKIRTKKCDFKKSLNEWRHDFSKHEGEETETPGFPEWTNQLKRHGTGELVGSGHLGWLGSLACFKCFKLFKIWYCILILVL